MKWNWLKQPRVVGMLVAKLVLSVVSPLAGQATDGMAFARGAEAQVERASLPLSGKIQLLLPQRTQSFAEGSGCEFYFYFPDLL
jgi:hypothetical protein